MSRSYSAVDELTYVKTVDEINAHFSITEFWSYLEPTTLIDSFGTELDETGNLKNFRGKSL